MEHLVENIEWLIDQLNEVLVGDGSFVLFDCPGQIELYSHLDVMSRLARSIEKSGFFLSAAYCADGTFIDEPPKFLAQSLT